MFNVKRAFHTKIKKNKKNYEKILFVEFYMQIKSTKNYCRQFP